MNGDYLIPFVEYYGQMGIATFPIHARSKVPVRDSHGHLDAATDPEAFISLLLLFEKWEQETGKTASIGLAARMGDREANGDYLLCLDIDEKNGKSGSRTLLERGFEPPDTLTATTRSGGRHLLYRHHSRRQTKPGWLGKESGLDIKANGGWIVVAPTSGYVWQQEPTSENIMEAPDWLISRAPLAYKTTSDNSDVLHRVTICCPVHEDKNPSLQIATLKDGSKIYHCFAGCNWADIELSFSGGK